MRYGARRAQCVFPGADELEQAGAAGHRPGVELKPVALRRFRHGPVVGVYLHSYRQARRWADSLREPGLEPLEADINPADRFLMERFVAGSALLQGEPRQRGRHLLLDNPAVKAADYRPRSRWFPMTSRRRWRVCSCTPSRCTAARRGRATRRVFMLGEGAQQDFVRPVPARRRCCRPFWTGSRTTTRTC